jgi:ABC-type glycerol-3-phosphate transport system permease component
MTLLNSLLIQAVYIVLNVLIAKYQAYRFDHEQKRISHPLWLICYTAACLIIWPPYKNYYLVAALLLMHLPVFNSFLNYFRTPRRAFFYTHPEDPHGSKIDKLWGEAYPAVFFFVSIAYLVVQFFI